MSIGIIIPVYNNEDFIEECILSCEKQSYKDINIYVVDDGSKDKSREKVKKLEEKFDNIKYIYQENQGVSASRNNGIENSCDDYICFLDSDDYLDKYYAEKMIKLGKDENADIVSCGTNIVQNGNISKMPTSFYEKEFLYNYLIGRNRGQLASFLIKRDLIIENNIRFEVGRNWSEDVDFLINLLSKAEKISVHKEYLTYYRLFHKDDNLSQFNLDQIEKDVDYLNKLIRSDSINLSKKEISAIKEYRIPSSIVFKLVKASKMGYDKNDIKFIYEKYNQFINDFRNRHGIRGVLLFIQIIKLKSLINSKKSRL